MKHRGFTLVELLVVIPAMLMVVAFLAAFLVTLFGHLLVKNGAIELDIQAQSALFNMRDDLFFANHFAGTNQPDTTDSHAPTGGWNAITNNALVVYENAFDKNRQNPARQLIYKQNAPYPCNSDTVSQNQFSTNTLIFFVQNGTLYERTLIPDQSANCLTTWRKQSCPLANATPSCPADATIAQNVQSFSLNYYDRNGNALSPTTLQANDDTFIQVDRVDVTLKLQKTIAGDTATSSATISIKKTD